MSGGELAQVIGDESAMSHTLTRDMLHLFTALVCFSFNLLSLGMFSLPAFTVTINKKMQSVIGRMKSHSMAWFHLWGWRHPDEKSLVIQKHMHDVIGAEVLNHLDDSLEGVVAWSFFEG